MLIVYAPAFIRQFEKLDQSLRDEVIDKLALFQERLNHRQLRVHKLKGGFSNCYSFSVNYDFRIVFEYGKNDIAYILSIGNHDIYK